MAAMGLVQEDVVKKECERGEARPEKPRDRRVCMCVCIKGEKSTGGLLGP